jgi:hypothetical protein
LLIIVPQTKLERKKEAPSEPSEGVSWLAPSRNISFYP